MITDGRKCINIYLKKKTLIYSHMVFPTHVAQTQLNMSGSYGSAMWFSVIYVQNFSPPKRKHLFLYNHWPHNSVKQTAVQKARIFHWKSMCVINTWIRHPSSLELVLYQVYMTQNNTPWIQHRLNVYGIFLRVWSLNLFLSIFWI